MSDFKINELVCIKVIPQWRGLTCKETVLYGTVLYLDDHQIFVKVKDENGRTQDIWFYPGEVHKIG